jgi:hypothetical protein
LRRSGPSGESEIYIATFRYGLSMDRNLLPKNRLNERETPLSSHSAKSEVIGGPPPRARNVKFMLSLSAHVDFSLGIPSLPRATLEMASERALETLEASNAVDDFVKPGVLSIFRVACSCFQSTRRKALTSLVEMRPGLIE